MLIAHTSNGNTIQFDGNVRSAYSALITLILKRKLNGENEIDFYDTMKNHVETDGTLMLKAIASYTFSPLKNVWIAKQPQQERLYASFFH